MRLINVDQHVWKLEGLEEQKKYATLEHPVHKLEDLFNAHAAQLKQLRVWLISSTAKGGGVAEMLPRITMLMRGFGVKAEWLVIEPDPANAARFFALTKTLHNNVHDAGTPLSDWWPEWVGDVIKEHTASHPDERPPEDASRRNLWAFRKCFEAVNFSKADTFLDNYLTDVDTARDLVVIHDPQPAAMVVRLRQRCPRLKIIWRCHIGLDVVTSRTQGAWAFLEPYLHQYDATTFSASEYIPEFLKHGGRSFVVHPGISPLAPKNRELNAYEITQILMRAGLTQPQQVLMLQARGCELIDAPFVAQARIYAPGHVVEGSKATASTAAGKEGERPATPGTESMYPAVDTEVLKRLGYNPSSPWPWWSESPRPASGGGGGGGGGELPQRDRQLSHNRFLAPIMAAARSLMAAFVPPEQLPPTVPPSVLLGLSSTGQPRVHAPRYRTASAPDSLTHADAADVTATGADVAPHINEAAMEDAKAAASASAGAGESRPRRPRRGSRLAAVADFFSGLMGSHEAPSESEEGEEGEKREGAEGEERPMEPPAPLHLSTRSLLGAAAGAHSAAAGPAFVTDASLLDLGIAFLHRPIVTQISRWDRLKGFHTLMKAWVDLKTHQEAHVAALDGPGTDADVTPAMLAGRDRDKHRRMLRNACLVLAGPDPRAIADDPEGLEVLQELKNYFDTLPKEVQRDIKIVMLPMEDAVENALIVNAIQRASNIIVQCSSREAFGLTATEAMYKRVAFIGTQAVGLRVQVRHQQDGILVQGDCTDAKNVARAINVLLGCDQYRHSVAVNGQKRAVDEFLIHRQMMDWIRCALLLMGEARPTVQHASSAPAVVHESAAAGYSTVAAAADGTSALPADGSAARTVVTAAPAAGTTQPGA